MKMIAMIGCASSNARNVTHKTSKNVQRIQLVLLTTVLAAMVLCELHQAFAELIAQPPEQVRFECVYDSNGEDVRSKAFHEKCDNLDCGILTIVEEPSQRRIDRWLRVCALARGAAPVCARSL